MNLGELQPHRNTNNNPTNSRISHLPDVFNDTRMRNSLLHCITGDSHSLKLSQIFLMQIKFLFFCDCSLEDFFFGT